MFNNLQRRIRDLIYMPINIPFGRLTYFWGYVIVKIFNVPLSNAMLRNKNGSVKLPVATFLTNLIKSCDCVFDIGAYKGFITILSAFLVGKKGEVHSFEPNPEVFYQLERIVNKYNFKHVIINQNAIGSENNRTNFFVPEFAPLASLSPYSQLVGEGGKFRVIKVNIITLDNYLLSKKVHPPHLLKVDVEGAELDVFRGAINLLTNNLKPIIIFEFSKENQLSFNRKPNEIFDFLSKCGYSFYYLKYPGLVKISCEEELDNVKPMDEFFTDILAVDLKILFHSERFKILSKNFASKITNNLEII